MVVAKSQSASDWKNKIFKNLIKLNLLPITFDYTMTLCHLSKKIEYYTHEKKIHHISLFVQLRN